MATSIEADEAFAGDSPTPSAALGIRAFREGDERVLRKLHREAIARVARADYDAPQLCAWLSASRDVDAWVARMRRNQPLLAVAGAQVGGYADVQVDGLIDHFFVSARWQGRGVARLLMQALRERAAQRQARVLHALVSRTAQPAFQHFGFEVVEERFPVLRGVRLQNALMRKAM